MIIGTRITNAIMVILEHIDIKTRTYGDDIHCNSDCKYGVINNNRINCGMKTLLYSTMTIMKLKTEGIIDPDNIEHESTHRIARLTWLVQRRAEIMIKKKK